MSALAAVATLPLAITKGDVGTYVNALFVVYTIMILINILLSFVPRIPYYPWLRAVLDFITESTDPYLNLFRSIMRPIGGSAGMALDFSPIIALLVLGLLNRIVVGAFF
jgi:YggT family protein